MATGNMFQGMARGKVGDVVFAVREGKQVSRVRNRKPKNPQTNKQIMQRAIMATILQAYSAGKEIFDHSFQGKSVGEQCAREFLSLNAKALRSAIAAEQLANTALVKQKAVVVLPKATLPVANEYVVSKGTYQQGFFSVLTSDSASQLEFPAANENETIAQYASRNGLVSGDIYTVVFFYGDKNVSDFVVSGYDATNDKFATNAGVSKFCFVRLQVKSSLPSTAFQTLGDVFEVTATSSDVVSKEAGSYILASESGDDIDLFHGTSFNSRNIIASVGVIRSRLDQDLRSDTTLVQVRKGTITAEEWNFAGIVGGLAVQAWKQRTAQLGDSDLILEGGE